MVVLIFELMGGGVSGGLDIGGGGGGGVSLVG